MRMPRSAQAHGNTGVFQTSFKTARLPRLPRSDAREEAPDSSACRARRSRGATGAGDAMCAGIALALAENGAARACAERGMRMSQAFLRARQNGEVEEAAPF